MDLRELQMIEYELLCKFSTLMEKNNIRYWLAYGTCLGGVRHKGFIPWDDDVDVYICGEDYPKLKQVFAEQNTGYMELHDFETKAGYPFVFPKIVNKNTKLKENRYAKVEYECGIYIDVFPLFEVSDYKWCRKMQYTRRALYRAIVEANYRESKHRIIKALKIFDPNKAQNKLYKIYTKRHSGKRYLAEPLQYGDSTKYAKLHKRNNFQSNDSVLFEDRMFPVPFDCQAYLTDQYGDYMTPPPPDKRGTTHGFEYILINQEEN